MRRHTATALSLTAGLVLLTAACADTVLDPPAREFGPAFSGNSAAAQACSRGGHANVYRADGTPFTNPGDCVNYAAQGGTLVTRVTTTLSDVVFSACNSLTLGYELGGTEYTLESKPYVCQAVYEGSTHLIEHFSNQAVRVFLRDDLCDGWTYYEDGNRASVTGTNPSTVRIMDSGGFCEFPPSLPRPVGGAFGDPERANLNLVRTVGS